MPEAVISIVIVATLLVTLELYAPSHIRAMGLDQFPQDPEGVAAYDADVGRFTPARLALILLTVFAGGFIAWEPVALGAKTVVAVAFLNWVGVLGRDIWRACHRWRRGEPRGHEAASG